MNDKQDTKDALSLRLSEVAALAVEQERPASEVALEMLGGEAPASTAAETIQAAIDKLETLSQNASVAVMFLPLQDDAIEYDLGTTLYRTIDAQLAILRTGLTLALAFPDSEWTNTVDLARAILGASS